MLKEYATYEELKDAQKEVREYGRSGYNNPRIMREFRHGKRVVWYRTRTPQNKYPALYYYTKGAAFNAFLGFGPKDWTHLGYLILEGTHKGQPCESYCGSFNEGYIAVVRGHAIYRYIERRHFDGSFDEAQKKILADMAFFDVKNDPTTSYIYYDGGVFLCDYTDGVLHIGTFVMNSKLYPVQRMKSLQSEKAIEELKKEIGIK